MLRTESPVTYAAATVVDTMPSQFGQAVSGGPRLQPAEVGERIVCLDILRGVALLGVLIANMRAFSAPAAVYGNITALFSGQLDVIAQYGILVLVQGKAFTLFSFLFGAGFALHLARAESQGVLTARSFVRRMLALALFGLIHGLVIWWGDILLVYALCGMVLVLFRKSSQRTLIAAICCLTAVAMVLYARILLFPSHAPAGRGVNMADVQQTIDIFASGSMAAILRENWLQWKASLVGMLSPPFGLYPLTLFLLGVLVARAGILTRLGELRPMLKRVCIICLPLGIALNALTFAGFMFLRPRADGGLPLLSAVLITCIWLVFVTLAAGYAAAITLVAQDAKWQQRLSPLALAGRLALTNYVMQSVLCTAFFYGTGLYGQAGPALGLAMTISVYALQIAYSAWWLERFNFGPLEWLWRGLTYGRLPVMRKHSMLAPAVDMRSKPV
ncbi:MAG: DUF418 domain-containing protein [Vicinamibacterales bacterium]